MSKSIFVNLPIADLARSTALYEAVGFTKNPQFSDETAACMALSDSIFVMLHTHDKWLTFTGRPITPSTSSEVMLPMRRDSRAAVDTMHAAGSERRDELAVRRSRDPSAPRRQTPTVRENRHV